MLAERNVSTGRVRVQNGSDVSALLDHLTQFLGRQPPLPDWIYSGAILDVQGGTRKVTVFGMPFISIRFQCVVPAAPS